MTTSKLKGKVAVITGGSSGIGLATAKRFVVEGAYVFITGRRDSELRKAKALIGRNVTAVRGDVSNLDDLDNLYKAVAEKKSVVDIVVANAAFVEMQSFGSVTPEHFDKTFGTNTRGVFFTVQKALPFMRNGGSIIVVAASGHVKGSPGRIPTSLPKPRFVRLRGLGRLNLKIGKSVLMHSHPELLIHPS